MNCFDGAESRKDEDGDLWDFSHRFFGGSKDNLYLCGGKSLNEHFMTQTYQEKATAFNPMQLQLLRMFSYVKTEDQLKEIKAALCDFFFKRVEEGMDRLTEQGEWSQEKEETILTEHLRTPYKYWWKELFLTRDDNKFVDCAIAANATYIVSDDSHFKPLEQISYPYILVIKLIEFLDVLSKDQNP